MPGMASLPASRGTCDKQQLKARGDGLLKVFDTLFSAKLATGERLMRPFSQ